MITEYRQAATVEEAVALGKDGFLFLAGGTQVNSAPFRKRAHARGHNVEKVVSLAGLGLDGISADGDDLVVGAMTTLQEIADSGGVPEALKKAAGFIPTRSVRNIATIGGNVGARRADSYLIPALIALGARAETAGGPLAVEEYVAGDSRELILKFRIPPLVGFCRALKESRSHLALPVVSAAARLAAEGGRLTAAVIAAGCVATRTIRLSAVEEGLTAGSIDPDGQALEVSIAGALHPVEDILGSVEFKTYLNSVLIADLIRTLRQEVLS